MIQAALAGTGLTDPPTASRCSYTPHDFRRIFITDAIINGLPPHIAQVIAGHRDINTTMGYKAVYPDEAIQAHRAFIARRRSLRPSEEYRDPHRRGMGRVPRPLRAPQGLHRHSAAAPTAPRCIHEHACLTEMILVNFSPPRRVRGVTVLTEGDREESWFAALAGVSPKMAAAQSWKVR